MVESAKKDPVIIISADYDGCFDAYYRDDTKYASAHEFSPYAQEYKKKTKFIKSIDEYISNIANGQETKTELYVGSLRQDRYLDVINMKHKNNGSVFEILPQLCKEKGWEFKKLLLADTQKNLAPGTTMDDINHVNEYRCKNDTPLNLKYRMLQNQLNDVANRYPDQEINFVFFDDDFEDNIFSYVEEKLTIPQHITMHLVKASYAGNEHTVFCKKRLPAQNKIELVEEKDEEKPFDEEKVSNDNFEDSINDWLCIRGKSLGYSTKSFFDEHDQLIERNYNKNQNDSVDTGIDTEIAIYSRVKDEIGKFNGNDFSCLADIQRFLFSIYVNRKIDSLLDIKEFQSASDGSLKCKNTRKNIFTESIT